MMKSQKRMPLRMLRQKIIRPCCITIESIICWIFAISCLLVSGYYYIIENYSILLTLRYIRSFVIQVIEQLSIRLLLPILSYHPTTEQQHKEHFLSTSKQTTCSDDESQTCRRIPWIPLMTYTRSELLRFTPQERYEQLLLVLQQQYHMVEKHRQQTKENSDNNTNNIKNDNESIDSSKTEQQQEDTTSYNWEQLKFSDDELVYIIRNHEIVRRLVSLALRPYDDMMKKSNKDNSTNYINVRQQQLSQQLLRIWYRLLILPSSIVQQRSRNVYTDPSTTITIENSINKNNDTYHTSHKIVLIIPYYKEQPLHVLQRLQYAVLHCNAPQHVHVVIVVAGRTAHEDLKQLQAHTTMLQQQVWGKLQIVEYPHEDGRGPAMNYGVSVASAFITSSANKNVIYTFCHSDTILPYHWDTTIVQSLLSSSNRVFDGSNVNACAFKFGIDTSVQGLQKGSEHNNEDNKTTTDHLGNYYYPPGIHAIEFTANVRCYLWSLPYGDQCLSVRAADFHYLGGYPHQCIMEDYDLIALLRKRTTLLSHYQSDGCSNFKNELLQILPGPPVLCSPRRWQKYGVLYVTYTNSRLVKLYNSSISILPETIYQLYYGQSLTQNAVPSTSSLLTSSSSSAYNVLTSNKSPWENELDEILRQSKYNAKLK